MLVRIRFFGGIREFTGKKWMTLELPEDARVLDVIYELARQLDSKLLEKILDENEEVRSEIIILLNGRSIRNLDGLKTEVKEDDIVSVFPVASGGY